MARKNYKVWNAIDNAVLLSENSTKVGAFTAAVTAMNARHLDTVVVSQYESGRTEPRVWTITAS